MIRGGWELSIGECKEYSKPEKYLIAEDQGQQQKTRDRVTGGWELSIGSGKKYRNQKNHSDRRRSGLFIIDQGWMVTIKWLVQGIFEIRGNFDNQLSKDLLSVGARNIRNKRKILKSTVKGLIKRGYK